MSGARLREAAALMRSRAKAARIGPWEADCEAEMWQRPIVIGPEYPAEEEGRTHRFVIAECHGFSKCDNAEHIASWHPAVALTVADLLDDGASYMEFLAREYPGEAASGDYGKFFLAVANAYLGDAQ